MRLGLIVISIDFDNVSCDPTKAALWVAKAVETFAVEVPVLSERGTSNGLSRSQTPSSKSARETEEDDIDLSKMMIDNREERIEDVVRSGKITHSFLGRYAIPLTTELSD